MYLSQMTRWYLFSTPVWDVVFLTMLKRNFPYLEQCKNLVLELVFIRLFQAFTLPEKTADIFMTLSVVSYKMIFGEQTQKFHPDDPSLPRSGWCFSFLEAMKSWLFSLAAIHIGLWQIAIFLFHINYANVYLLSFLAYLTLLLLGYVKLSLHKLCKALLRLP